MRLINTHTLDLEEFYGTEIPKYAILSHTWVQREEVTLQEWLRRDADTSIEEKAGYTKIMAACRLARESSLEWLWVDTNCIDKISSAELTEAINSMYQWYKESSICYAYLSDVSITAGPENYPEFRQQFSQSRWWTRGWTLQELLAPEQVFFFTNEWKFISNRVSLAEEIQQISGISQFFLDGAAPQTACAAEKMSWLSLRTTTRVEDMAYCMLGLFEINLPLLYGEGRRAFWRLQEEIIRVSNDHTIFCWAWNETVPRGWVSMLAPWPDTFADSCVFRTTSRHKVYEAMPTPYSMTNVGLSIRLPVIRTLTSFFVFLDVKHTDRPDGTCACVHINRLGESSGFRRCQFPRNPIMLSRHSAEKEGGNAVERLHDWIIASRVPSRLYGPWRTNNVPQNHGILLFVGPSIQHTQLDPITIPIALPQQQKTLIDTNRAVFDSKRSVFVLAPVRLHAYAGLWYLPLHSGREQLCICLFFAVVDATMPNESWHCSVALLKDIEHLYEGRYCEGGVEACGQAWFQKNLSRVFQRSDKRTLASTTEDNSFKLGIGGPASVDFGLVLRSAYLSHPEDFELPIPRKALLPER